MPRRTSPYDHWVNAMQFGLLIAEAQAVIAMRIWGMTGVWSVTPHENKRMVSEKLYALNRSVHQASQSALRGQRPEQITAAAIKPIRKATRANARRLAKRGPKGI